MMNFWRTWGAVLIVFWGCSQPVLAATEITGPIEGDTVWTTAESPFSITSVVNFSAVEPGATLTIEPGVVVEFTDGGSLNVFGNLIVDATPESPVSFSSAESGSWQVSIFDAEQTTLNNLLMTDSNQGLFIFNSKLSSDGLSVTGEDGGLYLIESESMLTNLKVDTGNMMVIDGQTTVNGLEITGGGILVVDGGGANFTNLISDGGMLSFTNTSVTLTETSAHNVTNAPAVSVGNSSLQINSMVLENVALGIDIYNNTTFVITGVMMSTINNGPALSVGDSTGSITNTHMSSGLSVGVNIYGQADVEMQNVSVNNFSSVGISVSDGLLSGVNLDASSNLLGITNSGTTILKDSKIRDNAIIGITHDGEGLFQISNSIIAGNSISGADSIGTNPLDARGNYWGDASGPLHETLNQLALGNAATGNTLIEPWLTEYCESNCYSNIMFLPGIMASRLYDGDNQLWEPGVLTKDSEFEALYLDVNGHSLDPNIATKDVLDNGYAYGQFVADLATMKASGVINDYEAVPYDWRLSMADVLSSGTKRSDGSIIYSSTNDDAYIEDTLRRLASGSKSGKVTIVAHSNGGLVTKALINQLGGEASGLIDKVIFVGVPQLGTPQAIGSLLHGYDAGLPDIYPFILSPERARDLAINMPMIYQLLPFSDYYDGEGTSVSTPYVTFEDGAATQAFIDSYGYAITPDELIDFLNGTEGRSMATYSDLANPTIANADLLANALSLQSEINSSWEAPVGIEVHQIAGVGETTLAGINYKSIKKCASSTFGICHQRIDALSYEPVTVLDGDGTVVAPSALALSDTSTKRWWVNLQAYNDTAINSVAFGFLSHRHANILETDELRDFIFNNLITKQTNTYPEYIYSNAPPLKGKSRLVFTLHSPLSLSAIDEDGNITDVREVSIPGSYYQKYGEVQTLTIPRATKFTIILKGETEGSFTLEADEIKDEQVIATTTFSAIPAGTSTLVTMIFEEGDLEDAGILQIDYNGDSVIDLNYTPVLGKTVYEPDTTVTTPIIKTPSGGNSRPQGQVLGVNTDLLYLNDLVKRLQVVITALNSLKSKIPEQKYIEIESKINLIIRTLLVNLSQL